MLRSVCGAAALPLLTGVGAELGPDCPTGWTLLVCPVVPAPISGPLDAAGVVATCEACPPVFPPAGWVALPPGLWLVWAAGWRRFAGVKVCCARLFPLPCALGAAAVPGTFVPMRGWTWVDCPVTG